VVDFGTPGVSAIWLIVPALERVAGKYEGRVQDESESIARRYAVMAIPTLILFNMASNGSARIGTASEERISLVIDKHLGTTEVGG
jgi:thioredoxin-like negative regulator of GroEL